ncbi:MAG: histidinol-phosphatase HisJ family protein [Erysipelotrichaceae bacterium]|nr:histidinol-phosphatase HisJ family protein [Erysipelotrichaceae bacterium]
MLADYHLHTEYSDDSREKMEKQVLRAIELGIQEICFTDHVDYGVKKDWSEGNIEYRDGDGMNYSPEEQDPLANVDYERYFPEIAQLREKYAGRIVIKTGLEFGIQTNTIDQFEKLYQRYADKLDFVLLSMHQVDNKELWDQAYQQGKNQKDYNEGYYKEILEVQKLFKNYSVLAHLDLIKRYDLNGYYPFEKVQDFIAEILKQAIKDGKGIEVNTSSWHYKIDGLMPSEQILKLYKDLGGKILTIGSDAHTTIYLGDHLRDTMDILRDSLGFETFCTFDHMKPVFHKL